MRLWNLFLHIAVQCLSLLPSLIQRKAYKLAVGNKQMNFDLHPNSIWVGYEIQNETEILKRIPPNLELCPVSVFKTLPAKKYLFFNFFGVACDYLNGNRLEIVTVVQDKMSKMKRFIILDYYSNTISSDPMHPFKKPNARIMDLISSPKYLSAYCDEKYIFVGKKLSRLKLLSSEFSIGCNKNIFYGTPKIHLPNHLEFDPLLISKVQMFESFSVHNQLWTSSVNNMTAPSIAFYYPQAIPFKIIPEKKYEAPEDYNDDLPLESFAFYEF